MTIGEKLQKKRKRLNLTQSEVAEKLHVSRQAISNWELDKNYPDLETIIALSDLYQISLDVLLKEDKKVVKGIKRNMNRKLVDIIVLLLSAFSLITCLIVDFAISHTFSWSIIVLLALAAFDLLWLVVGRIMIWHPYKIMGLISCLTISFLWSLDVILIQQKAMRHSFFVETALPISLLWLSILWVILFIQVKKGWEVYFSLSVLSLLAIVGNFLTKIICQNELYIWETVITVMGFLFLSTLFFILGNAAMKKRN